MSQYKILVIDDEPIRNEAYHKLLDESFFVEILNDWRFRTMLTHHSVSC